MSKKTWEILSLSTVLLLLVASGWGMAVQTEAAGNQRAVPGHTAEPRQESDANPDAPTISFIDSPSATCYQPMPDSDACYINWSYLSATASTSQYIISMTIAIDNRMVANYQGFFQTSLYVPSDLNGDGFRVSCGSPGAAGVPGLGRSHSYTVRARETGGLKAANHGSVTCPVGLYRVFLPVTLRSYQ
jgi:hypothetical protein